MDSPAIENDKKLGAFPYVIGGLSYIPLIGVLFGIIAIVWGSSTKRKGGKTLALVGAGGIGFTILVYGSLAYFSMQSGGVFEKLRGQLAQTQLNQLVQSIEFYKIAHGTYPTSLEELQKATPNTLTFIHDPMQMAPAGQPKYFYYERVGTDHYYLRGIGMDGQPFTADDIVPQVDASSAGKLGLLLNPPASK
jgi:Type II secretion system (T2SS), protein G